MSVGVHLSVCARTRARAHTRVRACESASVFEWEREGGKERQTDLI